jgi:hypothetical protein
MDAPCALELIGSDQNVQRRGARSFRLPSLLKLEVLRALHDMPILLMVPVVLVALILAALVLAALVLVALVLITPVFAALILVALVLVAIMVSVMAVFVLISFVLISFVLATLGAAVGGTRCIARIRGARMMLELGWVQAQIGQIGLV